MLMIVGIGRLLVVGVTWVLGLFIGGLFVGGWCLLCAEIKVLFYVNECNIVCISFMYSCYYFG